MRRGRRSTPIERLFDFVVRKLRWLARWPMLPHVFDGLLLAWVWLAHPHRLAAIEQIELGVLRIDGVRLRLHRFGGVGFCDPEGRELGHLHGHGLLDVRLAAPQARSLVAAGRARRHHLVPDAGWVSFPIASRDDVNAAIALVELAASQPRVMSGS